jgi:hypothetical protein
MENKTLVYKGKVYEIGQEYLFFDDNTKLIYGRLKSICNFSIYPFEDRYGNQFKNICAFSELEDHGTITPETLVNGAAYMFECDNHINLIGIFSKNSGKFIMADDGWATESDCTNIRKMEVKEGA